MTVPPVSNQRQRNCNCTVSCLLLPTQALQHDKTGLVPRTHDMDWERKKRKYEDKQQTTTIIFPLACVLTYLLIYLFILFIYIIYVDSLFRVLGCNHLVYNNNLSQTRQFYIE